MGGGIVKVKGLSIKTEINELPGFMWRDFFGFKDRRERKAATREGERGSQRRKRTQKGRGASHSGPDGAEGVSRNTETAGSEEGWNSSSPTANAIRRLCLQPFP